MGLLETILLIDLIDGTNRRSSYSELSPFEKKIRYKRYIILSLLAFLIGAIGYSFVAYTQFATQEEGFRRYIQIGQYFICGGLGLMLLFSAFNLSFKWIVGVFTSGFIGAFFVVAGGWIILYFLGALIGTVIFIPRLVYCIHKVDTL